MPRPPFVLYVHDDLTPRVRARFGAESREAASARGLLDLLRAEGDGVVVVDLEDQIGALVAQSSHDAFPLAVAIGRPGEEVAGWIHAHTGWFPSVLRVDAAREEDGRGGYRLISLGPESLEPQIAPARGCPRLAMVDDTVFSGFTLDRLLDMLGPRPAESVHLFCLRAVGETLTRVRRRCRVSAGFEAPGRLLEEVSFINASGLVVRGSIRRAGLPLLAFFERPEWIAEWFPRATDRVIAACRELCALLETAPGPPLR